MLWGIFLAIIVIGFIIVRSSTRDLVGVRIAVVDHQNIVSSVSTNGKVEPVEGDRGPEPLGQALGLDHRLHFLTCRPVR